MNNLKNKNIIVTGATGGIGSSIVKKLIENINLLIVIISIYDIHLQYQLTLHI